MSPLHSLRSLFFRATNDNKKTLASQDTPEQRLKRALNPPNDNTEEVLHGVPVKDPFRPLEKLDAPETSAWAARENKRYDDYMRSAKGTEAEVVKFFNDARPREMYESMPAKYGKKYIVWRTVAGAIRPALYIKDVPDYGAPARLLLDPTKIDPSGKTTIVDKYITGDGKTMAYRLSTSGSDKETLRFMDVETGKDLGLVYQNLRTVVQWDRDRQGFHYSKSDPVTKTRDVRYHKMGTPIEDDKVIYSPGSPEAQSGYLRLGKYEWVTVGNHDRNRNEMLVRAVGSNEPFREIFPNRDGEILPITEIDGRTYALTSIGAHNVRLVSFDINEPSVQKWQTIIPEDKQDQLTGAFVWQNKIFATYSHDTGKVLKVFDIKGQYLHDVPIPPLSTFTLGQRLPNDPTCLITYNNFKESGNVYRYDANTNALTLHKKSTIPIDLKDCIVERIQATSKDGTKVPMTVIRHPDTKLDGTAATLLYGYGGFNNALEPSFSTSIAQWVRAGGIYVQANLRGGGEYGQKWYDAGRKENKQNVFDDFAACAEHLIKTKYTTNKRLAIQGGSNGGLLTLATMIQRPELFGAVVSEVPVADMFRFHIGSFYGYSWKSDYGDPGIKRDFNIAAKYSPLHNVKKDFKHPPLLKIRTDGGHSAGMTADQWQADVASVRAFLVKTLGPINQQAYKAKLAAEQKAAANTNIRRKFG